MDTHDPVTAAEPKPPSPPASTSGTTDGKSLSPDSMPPLSATLRSALEQITGGKPIQLTDEESRPERLGPQPDCPNCGGHGWVRKNVPLGDPDFGRAFPCACAEPFFRAKRQERIFGRAQIPPEFGDRSFATYETLPEADQEARAVVQRWAEDGTGSLFLWGKVGRGKTGLSICALRHRMEVQGTDGLYRYVPDLFDDIRRGFDRELGGLTSGEIFDAVRTAGVLLFDDVGKEKVTPWVQEQFNRLIDYRWREQKPTIFTSNESLGQLERRLGEAAASRVRAMCWPNVLEVQGTDLREAA